MHIKTILFPDSDLLSELEPLPEGVRGVVWDLRSEPGECALADIDAVVLPYVDAAEILDALEQVPNLQLVQTQTTGYDGVIAASGAAAVANASGVDAAATAELTVGLILAKMRGIDTAVRDQASAAWNPRRGTSLCDRKVLLVGTGGIGQEIARRLLPFDVELTRVARSSRQDDIGPVHGTDELARLARTHDVLVMVTPLNDQTFHLVDEQIVSALPDGALVVNVGRGATIDSAALTREVLAGRLHCALDVFDPEPIPADHPLWASPNALITPTLVATPQLLNHVSVPCSGASSKRSHPADRPKTW